MYKKLLPMLLVSVMVFSITGCSNKSPVSKNPTKETTTALETTTTIEDNIIADDNTSNKEDNTSNDKTTEYDKTTEEGNETTSNEEVTEPITEPSGEGMTEGVPEPETKPSTEGTTSKPTTAPTVKPTEGSTTVAPTSKPTQAPTEAPTQKPTSAPTEAPTPEKETVTTRFGEEYDNLTEDVTDSGKRILKATDPELSSYGMWVEMFVNNGYTVWIDGEWIWMLQYDFVSKKVEYFCLKYIGSNQVVTMPISYEGNSICLFATFYQNPNITEVIIPASSTIFRMDYTFEECANLKTVSIGHQSGLTPYIISGETFETIKDIVVSNYNLETAVKFYVDEDFMNGIRTFGSGDRDVRGNTLMVVSMKDGSTAYYHPNLHDSLCDIHDKHLYTDYPEWVAQLR